MDSDAIQFLKNQRVSVVGILQADQKIHSATLHFAFSEHPDTFYFLTHKASRKCRSLVSGEEMNASVVIGFDENACATFQAEGTIQILTDVAAVEEGWRVYGSKYPERKAARTHPDTVLLKFIPNWTRFSAVDTQNKFRGNAS